MNGFGSTDLEDITCKCGKHPRLVESAVGTYILCPWCGTATYMCSNKKKKP
jgi:hypothetical protein